MKVRVFSGWAFPSDALDGLVEDVVGRTTCARQPGEVWVGWSLGGLEALALAAEQPRKEGAPSLSHLVLIASTARFCRDGEGWPGTEPAVLRGLQGRLRRDPAAALTGFHALCAGPETSPETVHARTTASLALDREGLTHGLDTLARRDVRPLLSQVPMPVLMLHGRDDRIIPSAAADRVARLLPHATRCEHPTAGHDLPLAQACWTADRIVEFLSRCSA
jgi:pimeloyl-[acyl-carrier protein] methyl ester esterase